MVKTLRNALFAKGNYFSYPKLSLLCGYVLEAGTHNVNWIRDLFHKNKGKIASSFRMSQNVAYVDNLNKQKVPPALALFSNELSAALEFEYGDAAKGAFELLKMFNNFIF